jgi:hypothetical protein
LEYEADLAVPRRRALVLAEAGDFPVSQHVSAGIGALQQPQEVHQGRLA